jgi:hypothetical protein
MGFGSGRSDICGYDPQDMVCVVGLVALYLFVEVEEVGKEDMGGKAF